MSDTPYIVTAAEIDRMEGLEKTHFLNPAGKRLNKSLGDLTGLTGLGVHLIEVQPGDESTEHHVHYHEDECVYILDGQATVWIGEEAHAVGAGDFIGYRKGGLPHSMKNTGDTLLRCLVIGQRLAHDVGEYTRQRKRIHRHDGLPYEIVDMDAITYPQGVGKK